jgi:hypothetical protein
VCQDKGARRYHREERYFVVFPRTQDNQDIILCLKPVVFSDPLMYESSLPVTMRNTLLYSLQSMPSALKKPSLSE